MENPASPEYRNLLIRSMPPQLAEWLASLAQRTQRPIRVIAIDALMLFQSTINGDDDETRAMMQALARLYK